MPLSRCTGTRWLFAVAALAGLATSPAVAQNTYAWNTGNGAWNQVTPNWTGAGTLWANPVSPPDIANFGGSGFSVQVQGNINVGTINLISNYTLFPLDAGNITLRSGGTITSPTINTSNAAGGTTISVPLNGTAGLTKAGPGFLILSGPNTYSGGTTVTGGYLQASTSTAFGTGTVTVLSGAGVTPQANGVVIPNDFSLAGVGDGRGAIAQFPAGITTTLTGGVALATDSRVFVNSGGTLNLNGAISGSHSLSVLTDGGTLALGGSAANTYTGTTTLFSGSTSGAALTLQKTGGVVAVPGDFVIGDGSNAYQLFVNHFQPNQYGPNTTVSFTNTGASNFLFSRFQLLGNSQAVAGITDSNGGGVVQNGGQNQAAPGNATLTLNGSGTYSFNGFLRNLDNTGGNTFSLIKNGNGTQTFTGGNVTYSGATQLIGGTLRLTNTSNFASAVTLGASGLPTLELNTPGASDNFTLSPVISGGSATAAVTKTGAGFVNVTGANTYAGGTTVAGGYLQASTSTAFGTGTVTVLSGATVTPQANGVVIPNDFSLAGVGDGRGAIAQFPAGITTTLTGGVALATDSRVFVNSGGTLNLNGAISGLHSLSVLTDGGTVALGGSAPNTYTGSTTLFANTANGAVLNLQKTGGVVAIPGDLIVGSGSNGTQLFVNHFQPNQYGPNTTVSFTNNGASNFLFSRFSLLGNSQTVAGISDTIGAGVVQNGSFSTAANTPATLTLSGAGSYSFNGFLRNNDQAGGTGTLSLVKSGSGTQTLTGGNITYTGTTQVSGGVLLLNGSQSGSGATSVANAATLGGSGTVSAPVSVALGGALAPGAMVGSVGTLTVADPVTFATGGRYAWDVSLAAPPQAAFNSGGSSTAANSDRLVLTGGANAVSGAFVLAIGELMTPTLNPALSYSFLVATGPGTANIAGATVDAAGSPTFAAYAGSGGTLSLNSSGGNVYLNLTPVAEIEHAVGAAVALLGAVRLFGRRSGGGPAGQRILQACVAAYPQCRK